MSSSRVRQNWDKGLVEFLLCWAWDCVLTAKGAGHCQWENAASWVLENGPQWHCAQAKRNYHFLPKCRLRPLLLPGLVPPFSWDSESVLARRGYNDESIPPYCCKHRTRDREGNFPQRISASTSVHMTAPRLKTFEFRAWHSFWFCFFNLSLRMQGLLYLPVQSPSIQNHWLWLVLQISKGSWLRSPLW